MSEYNMLFAGFGGQGVLFAGKVLSYVGLIDEKEVSWLPSYGPEMRGGTANCSVCIADHPIGSPQVLTPDVFIAMNLPSYDKFIDAVVPGGIVILDSHLINKRVERTDVKAFYIPASKLAEEKNLRSLANIILVGKVVKETGLCSMETLEKAIGKCVPPSKAHLVEANMRALELGMSL